MKMKRLKKMKETLIEAVQHQINNLEQANTHELGCAIDMIKDLSETIYYCSIVESMEDSLKEKEEMMEMVRYSNRQEPYRIESTVHYSDDTPEDRSAWEGKSGMKRKTYMEARTMHGDKQVHMKELDAYAQELTSDVMELIHEASPEEKQLLKRKVAELANKIV